MTAALLTVQGSYIKGSVIGCNTFVSSGCHIEDSLMMGNDNYTNDRERERARQQGLSVLGIGTQTHQVASTSNMQRIQKCYWVFVSYAGQANNLT